MNRKQLRQIRKLPKIQLRAEAIHFANKLVNKKPDLPYLDESDDKAIHIDSIDQAFTRLWKDGLFLLPNFSDSESLSIFSDYSGEHPSSTCHVYSFVLCNHASHKEFTSRITKVRQRSKMHAPYKEMMYKSLSYVPVKKALPGWLDAADSSVHGLIFNLIVDKKIGSFSGPRSNLKDFAQLMRENEYSTWNLDALEKVLRIVHIVGYLFGLTTEDGQNIFWMSDHDDIAINDAKKSDLMKMLRNSLGHYSKGKRYGKIGFATPFTEDIQTELKLTDLLSLADLAAGALSNLVNSSKNSNIAFKNSGNLILSWLGKQSVFLKKCTVYLSQNPDGTVQVQAFKFDRPNAKPSASDIPIFI